MSVNKSDFIENYQNTLFIDKKETSGQRTGIQRKCLAQTYNYSLGILDEDTVCYLLEDDLQKYGEILDKDSTNSSFFTNDKVGRILGECNITKPVNLKSNLKNIDLKVKLPNFPCFKSDKYVCENLEITESDVKVLMDSLNKPKSIIPTNFGSKKVRSNSEDIPKNNDFKTARNELVAQNLRKHNSIPGFDEARDEPLRKQKLIVGQKRTIGLRRTGNTKFVPPLLANMESLNEETKSTEWSGEMTDERLKNIDAKMIELIKAEIMSVGSATDWSDIVGLEFAKNAIQEAVIWPMLRPDIFTGLRRPPKGILLFGPPGTGKTLIGKCVASQSKSTFFSISASSLTSKWVGEGEKMVRALFAVARCHQPAVIFIDEIDSLLSQRSESEHESSRRIKTEFLVQLDGATTDNDERLLLIGATNRPQELDEAVRRRFVKRLYIPLPEFEARRHLICNLISSEKNSLNESEFEKIALLSDGYSCADIRNLCSEASLGPIRSINMSLIEKIQVEEVRPLLMEDFTKAFTRVKSSVSSKDLEQYISWDNVYGAGL